jgi:hypothetical protein
MFGFTSLQDNLSDEIGLAAELAAPPEGLSSMSK